MNNREYERLLIAVGMEPVNRRSQWNLTTGNERPFWRELLLDFGTLVGIAALAATIVLYWGTR